MPFTPAQYPLLTAQQMGVPDVIASLMQGQKYGQSQQMFPQTLLHAQQVNQWYPKLQQSLINLQTQQGGMFGSEAQKNRFLVQNPQYINLLASMYGNQQRPTINQPNQLTNQNTYQPPSTSGGGGMNNTNAMIQSQINNNPNQMQNNVNTSPPSNQNLGDYGLSIPSLSASATNPLLNKVVGISPMDAANIQLYNQQKLDQYNKYSQDLDKANRESLAATNMKQNLSIFNNAMDQTDLSGGVLGYVPPGTSSPAQIADKFSTQYLPNAAGQLKEAMGSSRFSNLDMQIAQQLGFGRTMNKGTRQFYTNWANAVSDRMQEQKQLFNYTKNPANKIRDEEANTAWSLYQQQNPIVNNKGNGVNTIQHHTLSQYLTPEAMDSIRRTGTYTPPDLSKSSNAANDNTFSTIMMQDGKRFKVPQKNVKALLKKYKQAQVVNE
jgi:hypothetical protein